MPSQFARRGGLVAALVVAAMTLTPVGSATASGAVSLPILHVGDGAAVEGNSGSPMLRVPVTLSDPALVAVSADYSLSPGTASVGTDYVNRLGTVHIAVGSMSGVVSIPVIADRIDESNETVVVRLSGVAGATVGLGTGTARILDDDPMTGRQFGVGDSTVTEGASMNRRARFVITLSSPKSSPATVHYATVGRNAVAAQDFVATTGEATFAAGETAVVVSVPVVGDPYSEPDEAFSLVLSAPSGAVLGRTTGRGVIRNDDGAQSVPSAPGSPEAIRGNAAAAVHWTKPNADGRTPITAYQVRTSADGGTTWSAPVVGDARREAIIDTLVNGVSSIFEVAAVNAVGVGPWSAPTNAVVPAAGSRYVAIGNGSNFSCGVTDVGSVECWGRNTEGQLGDGTTLNRSTPTPIGGLAAGIRSVGAGLRGGCAVTFGHGLLCWGDVTADGSNTFKPAPAPVVGLGSGIASLSVGFEHACAITDAGAAWCWGSGGVGGGTVQVSRVPVAVVGLDHGVTQIAAGFDRTCAVVSGAAWCWGNAQFGALGNGGEIYAFVPVAVVGLPASVTQVDTGQGHSCARLVTGAVMCWGFNSRGQLGDGSTTNSSTPVAAIAAGATDLSLGGASSCALVDGGLHCWGHDPYDLVPTSSWPRPTTMAGLEVNVTAVSARGLAPCVIQAGATRCLGWNTEGQLGDGTTAPRVAPVRVLRATVPGVPTGLSALPQSNGAFLKWTDGVPGASPTSFYRVRVSSDLGQTWTERNLGWSTPAQRLDNLSNGTSYVVEVAAVNAIGRGAWSDAAAVTPAGPSTSYSKVDVGGSNACGLASTGAVRCWGTQGFASFGGGSQFKTSDVPITVLGLGSGVVDLSLSYDHACAVTAVGNVQCWGVNASGQLGDGTTADSATPVVVSGLTSAAVKVTAGYRFTCALLADGHVSCWGYGADGELGNGSLASSPIPVDMQDAAPYSSIDAGMSHVCGRTVAGGVHCWGLNDKDQLGNGGVGGKQSVPVDVSGLASGVQSVVSGDQHSCAVVDPGALVCWGANNNSQLGTGTGTLAPTPVGITGLGGVVHSVATGPAATCAVVDVGAMQCWGNEPWGLPFIKSYDPATFGDFETGVASVAIGGSAACLVDVAGAVSCWGMDFDGRLGDGETNQVLAPHVERHAPPLLTSVEHGAGFACGLTASGGVRCWGRNDRGQLGDGTTADQTEPVDVLGLSSVAELSVGVRHACAVLDAGDVWCWGDNSSSQVGSGSPVLFRAVPEAVVGLPGPTQQVSSGPTSTCAVLVSGALYCWGANTSGWLGVTGPPAEPALVAGLGSPAVRVATSLYNTCAVLVDGSVACWGYNYNGGVGDGTSTDRTAPVTAIPAGSGATDVSISLTHACALAAGGVSCWGTGAGLFGAGGNGSRSLPATVSGLSGTAASVSVTHEASCVLLLDGEVQCWGSNASGLVGSGVPATTTTPVTVLTGAAMIERGKGVAVQYAATELGDVWWWGARGPVTARDYPIDIAD